MRLSAYFLVLSFLVAAVTSGGVSGQQKKSSVDPTKELADGLTTELLQDGVALPSMQRAVLFARLGELWWPGDRRQASKWLKESVSLLESEWGQANPIDLEGIETVRLVARRIYPLDQTLSSRTLAILESSAVSPTDAQARSEIARVLADAGQVVVDRDTQRAFDLGTASLRLGYSHEFSSLLSALISRDARLGTELFMQAISVARSRNEPNLFMSLMAIGFSPESTSGPSKLPGPLQQTLAMTSVNALFGTAMAGDYSSDSCRFAWTLAPYLNDIGRLMPEQFPLFRESISRCQSGLQSLAREKVKDALGDQTPKTVEDYLKAAENESDPSARAMNQVRAARLAERQKNYDRAISIADDISEEARAIMNGNWETLRRDLALKAALSSISADDLPKALKTIHDTPKPLRVQTLIGVAQDVQRSGRISLTRELIKEARAMMAEHDGSKLDRLAEYGALIRLYDKVLATETPLVFAESVDVMHRIRDFDDDFKTAGIGKTEFILIPLNLPSSLLEKDQAAVTRYAIAGINWPIMRVRVRLDLLRSLLSTQPKPLPDVNATRGNY
jgi:hypothetical protein